MPKSIKNPQGFTLVELLVVISIIAILSVIGLTIFGSVQKNSRDARRKEDINAIADAMEANYSARSGVYAALVPTMFSQGVIPTDPINTVLTAGSTCTPVCRYCVRNGAEAQVAGACPNTSDWLGDVMPGGASNPYWTVCANLEGGRFYCRSNIQ